MAQTSWTKSLTSFFKKKPVALSPESYLDFSRRCLQKVRKMTLPRDSKSSEVVNYEQCIHLVDSLEKAVHKANLFLLECNLHHGANSESLENLKILCMLAKKVKSFVQDCCNGHWLQAAVMLTDLPNCTASLGFDLKLFTVLLPPFSALPPTFSLVEVSALRNVEGELVKEMASNDEDRLVTKLRALIRLGQASGDDLELATFLLERLDKLKRSLPSLTPGSPQPTLRGRDLTNLKDLVLIGRGGYGTVHKASWLGIDVAVKTFHGADNLDFNQEVTILARLSHPNIVSFLCHGKDMGECYIVMELMDQDLFSLLKERLRNDRTRISPFSVFEEFDIMLQIAEAMDYLHKMRVLHRDLKSHNILVRCLKLPNAEGYEYVQVKVSDFGLSRTKEYSTTQSHMTPNTGTARWMAPELIEFRNTSDIRDIETAEHEELMENYPFKCDVYSFGMVCLEILTGDVPFPNMAANDVKRAVCAGERPQLPDRCHEKLKALIEDCWNPKASSRPCFGDICTELRHLKSLHMTRDSQLIWTCMTFAIADLRSVTKNFAESNILGRGHCSVVHKGILADGRKVAVKLMKGAVMTRLGLEFIEFELGGWMCVRHPYLVEILGYCIDGNDLLVVSEFMSGGSLAQLLLDYDGMDPPHPFTWRRRLKIAMDIAVALNNMCESDSIFPHSRLKSSDVLLDDDFNAKVSGFGQTKRSAESLLPQGATSSGNMAPEYSQGGLRMRTGTDDVYSFGVVLMELIAGCPSVNKEPDIVTWFRERVSSHLGSAPFSASIPLRQVLKLGFYMDEFPATDSLIPLVKLAMDCTATDPLVCPSIDQVLSVLRRLLR